MNISRLGIAIALLVAVGVISSCDDETTDPQTTSGACRVGLEVMGDMPVAEECTVDVDGDAMQPLAAGTSVLFTDLESGIHVVSLAGLESGCMLNCANPVIARVTDGDTTDVLFQVSCGDPAPEFDVAGMEILGSGYNIGGNYADVADVRARVLDLTALNRDDLLRQVQYERASYNVITGETSREYLNNLQVKVSVSGSGFGFSGALKAGFSQERYESQHYAFATVQSVIRKHGLRVALSVTPEALRGYLTPAAAAVLNDPTADPLDVFDTFGTHVLGGIIVGGRLDFTTSANMSFERQDRTIDVYARASFKSLFASASIETQVIDEESKSEFSATEEMHLEVYGGRSEYGQYIINEGEYENWVESVDENSVFMDFESTGLLGIWLLAEDADRRTEIFDAFQIYAEANGISLTAAGIIVSNFADDDEGWVYHDFNDNTETPEHYVQDGYFGGYIVGSEGAEPSPDSWMNGLDFSAPSKFLGNKSPYAGGTLEYALWYSPDPWDIFDPPDWHGSISNFVVLTSENGNLVYGPANSDHVPDPEFRPGNIHNPRPTMFVINLIAGVQTGDDGSVPGRWYRWDGAVATDADIWMSMANIREIKIWGDYLDIEDRVALDKVALKAPLAEP
jgi:MAC/Perforin domain